MFIIYYPNTVALDKFKADNADLLKEMKDEEVPVLYAENASYEGIKIEIVQM